MSKFLNVRNIDNVYHRNLFVTILNLLSEKIRIQHVINKNDIKIVTVPFFWDASGDERFMQDLFLQQTINDFIDIKVVEGNIDVLPRGHVSVASIAINQGSLTQKFTFSEFTREKDGELLTYVAPINWLPYTFGFNIEIHVDGKLIMFKIIEQISDTFYKALPFKFLYSGLIVEGRIGFPETQDYESKSEFTFPDPTRMTFTINMECEAYKPVIDESLAVLKSNRIEQWTVNTFLLPDEAYKVNNYNPSQYQVNNTKNDYDLLVRNYNNADSLKSNVYLNKGLINGNHQIVLDDVYSQISGSNQFYNDINSVKIQEFLRTNVFQERYGTTNVQQVDYIPPNDSDDIDKNMHSVGEFGIPTRDLNHDLTLNIDKDNQIIKP